MRLRLTLPKPNIDALEGKLSEWNTVIFSKDESASNFSIVSLHSTQHGNSFPVFMFSSTECLFSCIYFCGTLSLFIFPRYMDCDKHDV